MRQEIRIAGFGGQGTILAGVVLGEAAVRAGHHAVQTQSYGPESRGGAARSEVVVADEPIDYPRVSRADVLVALSQGGYDKYGEDLAPDGIVVVDEDLVEADAAVGERLRVQPFTKTAEGVGHQIVTNIVMLGYLAALTGVVPHDVLEATVLDNVPPHTRDLNRAAVRAGRDLHTGEQEGGR